MPFNNERFYSFTQDGIALTASRCPGIYGIFSNALCVYVGQTDDIQAALYEHLRGQSDCSRCILFYNPTAFTYDSFDGLYRISRQRSLTEELRPICAS